LRKAVGHLEVARDRAFGTERYLLLTSIASAVADLEDELAAENPVCDHDLKRVETMVKVVRRIRADRHRKLATPRVPPIAGDDAEAGPVHSRASTATSGSYD
jgi:hypothetical protein